MEATFGLNDVAGLFMGGDHLSGDTGHYRSADVGSDKGYYVN